MIKRIKNILSKLIICSAILLLPVNAFAAESNFGGADVGPYGVWTTPHNQQMFNDNLNRDLTSFQSGFQNNFPENKMVENYVPVDAKVGIALIGAMTMVSDVLGRSLIPFIEVFLIALFIFWVGFETYQMMTSDQNVRKLSEDIVKKLVLISIWIWVIHFGPAKIFMLVMGPVLQIGSHLSELILNSVTNAVGYSLPNTCGAIHNYLASNQSTTVIDVNQAANIVCTPTRLSGFFYTAVSAGWKWMIYGIGHSAFTFTVGATFVVLFMYSIWKFALMTLGVVFDLFLGLIMLPFTAVAECFGNGQTSYKGYGGAIFNKFLELFKNTENLSAQINRFINATIYFVSLSIAIALCAAILSGVIDMNMANSIPTVSNGDFLPVLIAGALVAYLSLQADAIAKKIGGSIDSGFGDKVRGDVKNIWGKTTGKAVEIWKIVRNRK